MREDSGQTAQGSASKCEQASTDRTSQQTGYKAGPFRPGAVLLQYLYLAITPPPLPEGRLRPYRLKMRIIVHDDWKRREGEIQNSGCSLWSRWSTDRGYVVAQTRSRQPVERR